MNSRIAVISCNECGSMMHMDHYDMMMLSRKDGIITDSTIRTVMCPQCHKSIKVGLQATFVTDEKEILDEVYGMMDMEDCQIFADKFNKIYKGVSIDNAYDRVMPIMHLVAHSMRPMLKDKMIECVRSSMITHLSIHNELWYNFIGEVNDIACKIDEIMGL